MQRLLLKDALVAEPGRISRQDILIEGQRIAKIAPDIDCAGAEELDCHELIALPGMIDAHVHFREPGMEQKATIKSEARAAVLGGVTSFMEMPNTLPPTLDEETLNHKRAIAAKDSPANYSFYLGASPANLEAIKRVDPATVPAVKVYMGSTTGSLLLDEEDALHQVFAASPILICAHCEDNALINKELMRVKEQYGENIPYALHPIIRGRDCCLKSTKTAINTALDTGAKLHIMHLSTKEETALLQYFAKGSLASRQITAEACIPHLFFSECDYTYLGPLLKCNPAVKTEADRRALVRGIKTGAITTAGTDHAPHELKVKTGSYLKTASGVPSVQFALNALLTLWQRRELTLEEVIKASSLNVAARYQIKDRGIIKEGYYADLALINLTFPWQVHHEDIASLCGFSPFEGQLFTCRVVHTVVSGTLAVKDSKLTERGTGQMLEYARG